MVNLRALPSFHLVVGFAKVHMLPTSVLMYAAGSVLTWTCVKDGAVFTPHLKEVICWHFSPSCNSQTAVVLCIYISLIFQKQYNLHLPVSLLIADHFYWEMTSPPSVSFSTSSFLSSSPLHLHLMLKWEGFPKNSFQNICHSKDPHSFLCFLFPHSTDLNLS